MKNLLKRFASFLRAQVILSLPGGITADPSSPWGYFGMLSNLNAYAINKFTIVTAGTNSTLTAAQAIAGALRLTAGASGGYTITLPSTVAIIAALGPTIPTDGSFSKMLNILNDNVAQTGTLTVGDASTTLTGTATIATNTRRQFLLTVTSPTAITIQNFGSQAI